MVAGLGVAAVATGSMLIGVRLPSEPPPCSFSTRECAAPPGDPAFSRAQSAVDMVNAGVGFVVGGGTTMIGGILWYWLQPKPHGSADLANLLLVGLWLSLFWSVACRCHPIFRRFAEKFGWHAA
jgi:hypothetical protein